MADAATKDLYFHVGLGKVASKYLQFEFFPQLENIFYIPTTKYFQVQKIIQKTDEGRILISREFDQQMEEEVKKFSSIFPNTSPILILRRQDAWIASQFRRFAKNGYVTSFNEFIDIKTNKGRFKIEDLFFMKHIQTLEQHFTKKPLVLFYDELLSNPYAFLDKLAAFTGAAYDKNSISLEKKHTSYEEKQLKVMIACRKYISFNERTLSTHPILRFIQRLPVLAVRYFILYGALLIPSKWISKKPLIDENDLEEIRALTKEDWDTCLEYAKKNTID